MFNNFWEYNFLQKKDTVFSKTKRTKCHLKEICSNLNIWIVNFYTLNLHLLHLFYPIFTCLDPEPVSEYGTGSTKAPEYRSGSTTLDRSLELYNKVYNATGKVLYIFKYLALTIYTYGTMDSMVCKFSTGQVSLLVPDFFVADYVKQILVSVIFSWNSLLLWDSKKKIE